MWILIQEMSQTGSHSADSRAAGVGEADLVAAVVAVADQADNELSLHSKQVGVHFVTAVTVPMNYSGDPRCIQAEEEVVAAVAAAPAAAASEPVAESIHSDLRFH